MGQHRRRKRWNLFIIIYDIFAKICPNRQKNLDYWYVLNKYSTRTQNFDVFCTSWMKSNKNAKVEQLTKMLLSREKEKALSLKILCVTVFTRGFQYFCPLAVKSTRIALICVECITFHQTNLLDMYKNFKLFFRS